MDAATALLRDWRAAQAEVTVRSLQGDQGNRTWMKPEVGWLKINTDAAVFQDGSIGVGAVIRDSQGCFIGAGCCKVEGAWSSREAEAISMKEALSWIINRAYNQCVFETDLKSLVSACNGYPGEAFFGTLVLDCVHLLKHINNVPVKFVY